MKELSKEEMLREIYEVVACKDLTFGCRLSRKGDNIWTVVGSSAGYGFDLYQEFAIPSIKEQQRIGYIDGYYDNEENFSDEYRIIGLPIMIGDLLEFQRSRINKYLPMFQKKTEGMNQYEKYKEYKRFIEKMGDKIVHLDDSGDYDYYEGYDLMDMGLGDIWEDMRKPLDDQTLDLIKRVHDLVISHNPND